MKNITVTIELSPRFNKLRKTAPLEIKIALRETLEVFNEFPNHPSLRRHFLKDEYAGYESIDVTDDYRAVFKETKSKNQITIQFYALGTHKELYGRSGDEGDVRR